MKSIRITLVSSDLPEGCGLSTYYNNLAYNIKKKDILFDISKTIRLFGHYPIGISPAVRNRIAHFTDQRSASALFFQFFRGYKSVITAHDLTEIINFNNVCRTDNLYKKIVHNAWSWVMKAALRKADAIIADSEYTRKELIRVIGHRKNVTVVHIAAEKGFRPYKLKKDPYSILYVGSNLAHKNLKTLLKAFSILNKSIPQARLVLVGRSLACDKSLTTYINETGLQKKVIFRGYVEGIQKEYSKAILTVVPSLYEGFGLPVLEAMACGCPVICSDKTSLPEVGGDAAIYFNGHDADDLAKKMKDVLSDGNLQEEMKRKGLIQASTFSWERCAEETIKVYRGLI